MIQRDTAISSDIITDHRIVQLLYKIMKRIVVKKWKSLEQTNLFLIFLLTYKAVLIETMVAMSPMKVFSFRFIFFINSQIVVRFHLYETD